MARTAISSFAVVWVLVAFAGAQPQPPRSSSPPRSDQRQPPPPVPAGETRHEQDSTGIEPLVHGPVHEAFAAPTLRELAPPPNLSELPPEPPEELPSPFAPDQDQGSASWIPGYWGWDAREQGYVWISGTWRYAPPEMEWVPGYWATTDDGCRWVAGFWAHRGEEDLAYLPSPPALREEQPPLSPGEAYVWIPGNWQYVEEAYRWKPGFWAEGRDDWMWIPDCYAWTPRGYIFVRGYWDQPLERRGTLFAPLAFNRQVRRVTPTVVIDMREALVHWFVAPTYRHYCFGDYYGVDGGLPLASWYEYGNDGTYSDPMLAYYSKHDGRHFRSLKAKHKQFKSNVAARPALAWRDYRGEGAGNLAFALSSSQAAPGFTRIDFADSDLTTLTGHYRSVIDRRVQFERGAVITADQSPVFVEFDRIVPPGHGGLPPGLAKKGLVTPGFGGAPPGQSKKVIESFGPIAGKPPKVKFDGGNGGKGKGGGGGKGKGQGKGRAS